MTKHLWLLCSFAVSGFAESGTLTLSLDQAQAQALQRSPALRAAALQTRAADQAVAAAGRWINPRLQFEAEGVGGDRDGFSEAEYTLALQQTFALGGKRSGERDVAQKTVAIAFRKEAEAERNLMAEVQLAFFEVLAQQEIGAVRAEQEQLGRAFVEAAGKRYEAGAGSELEVVQAELELEETLLSKSCYLGDLAAARETLASLIGIPVGEMGRLEGDFHELENPDSKDRAGIHPALRRMDAEIATLRAEAGLALRQDAVDLTLEGGVRHEEADGIRSFVFGGSVPLNFSRTGRVLQTVLMVRADALAAQRDEVERKLRQERSVAEARYSGALLESGMVRDKLMPKAEKAYALSLAGYQAGRFSWFELIAAQQRLADIRIRYIEALRDAHLARAQIQQFMTEEI